MTLSPRGQQPKTQADDQHGGQSGLKHSPHDW
jgi:hypothetical protein